MAINVKSVDVVTKKWAARAGAAGADYSAGVQNPKRDQAAAASAAAATWALGVQQAAANNSFAKGVTKDPTKWARNALAKGAQRYPSGVSAAQPDFSNGIGPYLQVIAGLTLPPRLPKGDPGNIQRVQAVTSALRAKKLSG